MGPSSIGVNMFGTCPQILQKPWVECIFDAMFGTDLSHGWCNVGIPRRTHAGKQVMFDLKVETAREAARHKATICAGRFHLTLAPTNLLAGYDGIAFHRLIVVRNDEEC